MLRVVVLWAALTAALPALAGPFDRSADTFGSALNETLRQAGLGLRINKRRCNAARTACRYATDLVDIVVRGAPNEERIEEIVFLAKVLIARDEAEAREKLANALVVLGATMAAFDPQLSEAERAQILYNLAEAALTTSTATDTGVDARYYVNFDTEGRLGIIVIPKG